jgi:hypothetical protein|tara:strand:- start:307 stop:699 length:393 start_codon:yes stop_codon:yes gene_type:complete
MEKSKNFEIKTIYEKTNTNFGVKDIHFGLKPNSEFGTIDDNYSVMNEIITLSLNSCEKSKKFFKMGISVDDWEEPRVCQYLSTGLKSIEEINADSIFDILESKSEDDDNFMFSGSTSFLVQLVYERTPPN